jgi:GxxExxY protein
MNTDNARINTDKGLKGAADISEAVIGAAFDVANTLGCGFLEKVYENALAVELRRRDHEVEQQREVDVWYKGERVGYYHADLIVDGSVVVELKAVVGLERAHRAQCLNYLRATRMETGLVINFGSPRVEVQRVLSTLNS